LLLVVSKYDIYLPKESLNSYRNSQRRDVEVAAASIAAVVAS